MIFAIIIAISLLGLLLFALLIRGIRQANEARTLKRHRSKQAGVADLLNYGSMIDDGIILCKNGSLMAAYVYAGKDSESHTERQQEFDAELLNAALAELGNGWMIHVDAVRSPAPKYPSPDLSHFPDPVSKAIDEERRCFFEEQGELFEGYSVLTVTWFPPMLVQSKFVDLMFDDAQAPSSAKERGQKILSGFKKDLKSLENRLSAVLSLTRLCTHDYKREDGTVEYYDEFLSHLQRCITGEAQPVRLPSCPVYLDMLLGGQELWGGIVPKIGRKHIQVVAIEGFPMESYPGMLSLLTDFDMEYRWSNRFIFLDSFTATSHMDTFLKKWKQKQRGLIDHILDRANATLDKDAVDMTEDAEDAIARVKSRRVGSGYYTSVVVLMDENRQAVEAAALRLDKAIRNLGFASRTETINCLDAFFGSLPGHGNENVRRPLLTTQNLADMLPTNTIWTGSDHAPCPLYPEGSPALMYCVTTGNSPFRLNLHVRDLGHTLMIGPTGAGKSTALALITAQLRRYPNMHIFAFDKGLSLYPLTKACGGLHFTIAADNSKLQFCPLQFLDSKSDHAWAQEWLETILFLNGIEIGPGERIKITQTLNLMAQNKENRRISDFVGLIDVPRIKECMQAYTIDGPMGELLDAEEDGLSLSPFTVFETEELMNLGEKWLLPILLYLFRRIEMMLKGQPAWIFLDEAWIMLGHPVFREKIREWFKVNRKKNCGIFMATQSLSDALNSSILDVIIESTATKIYLPNINARNEDFAALYSRMGLNNRQIEIISSAIPKNDYYLVSEKGCRLFSFAIGPLAMSFVGVSDRESVSHIMQLEKQYGEQWIDQWLHERGLSLTDYASAS